MVRLLAGTADGILWLDDAGARPEGDVPAPRFLARTAQAVYAFSAENSIWRRDEDGAWTCVAEHTIDDEVWTFAADPRLSGRLYLGVSPALLYRSDDGGASWTACDTVREIPGYDTWTFPPPPHIPHVRSVAPDPAITGGIYIGVEEGGIFRSPNGGRTWLSLNEGLYWDVHTVTPAPDGRLYATTGDGFYRSDDGGDRWTHYADGLDRGYTVTFAASPADPNLVFTAAAATPPPGWRNGANAALYRSADGGEHWERLHDGLPERFDRMVGALVTERGNRVAAAAGGSVYLSEDRGEHWRTLADGLPAVTALLPLAGAAD
ncbi:MAG TPA: exo-alpha-sialidase [Dehalococcoidia bacterium]|nr:exo-alpha-sialidase [Dehalococcoidia bacterium]